MNDTLKTIIKIVAVIAIIWIAIPLISFAFQLVIVVLGVFLVYRGIKKLINKTKENKGNSSSFQGDNQYNEQKKDDPIYDMKDKNVIDVDYKDVD